MKLVSDPLRVITRRKLVGPILAATIGALCITCGGAGGSGPSAGDFSSRSGGGGSQFAGVYNLVANDSIAGTVSGSETITTGPGANASVSGSDEFGEFWTYTGTLSPTGHFEFKGTTTSAAGAVANSHVVGDMSPAPDYNTIQGTYKTTPSGNAKGSTGTFTLSRASSTGSTTGGTATTASTSTSLTAGSAGTTGVTTGTTSTTAFTSGTTATSGITTGTTTATTGVTATTTGTTTSATTGVTGSTATGTSTGTTATSTGVTGGGTTTASSGGTTG